MWLHPHDASSQLPTSFPFLHTTSSHNLHMLAPYLDISCPFIFSIPCSHLHIHHLSLKHDCSRYYLFTSFFLHMSYICFLSLSGHPSSSLTIVVNFVLPTSWADLTLLCVKICRFFWAEIRGKKVEIPRKKAEMPGQTQHDLKMRT